MFIRPLTAQTTSAYPWGLILASPLDLLGLRHWQHYLSLRGSLCIYLLFFLPLPSQQSLSKPAFFRQNSERRNFKLLDTRKLSRDGTGSPSKISPPSTPSSPDDTFFNLGDLQNGRKKRKIPKVRLATSFVFRGAPPTHTSLQRKATEESGQRSNHWALLPASPQAR